ncbi:MAG: hypothetical protein B7Z37_28735 [Verrucomicrobia bacterium 12-59-8]|nr:MAG: hypothetical protein B7Z37_28735 [Verrucomicrobia bacterium 12-59-8]
MKKTACHHPMSTALKKLPLLLIALSMVSHPVRAQSENEERAAHEKKQLAKTRQLAASSDPKDRLRALNTLFFHDNLHPVLRDFDLHLKLMNDPDMEVRLVAIGVVLEYYQDFPPAINLPEEMAEKMTALLEKEVTPERISAVFAPGHVEELPSALVLSSAVSLNHLYAYHFIKGSAHDYIFWQRRVLQPLAVILATRNRELSDDASGFHYYLLSAISDPTILMEVLSVLMGSMDSPDFPPERLEETLSTLWNLPPLLGKDGPLHPLLVAQLAPRLEALAPRMLNAARKHHQERHTEQFINEITEAVQTARERLAPPTAKAAGEKAR